MNEITDAMLNELAGQRDEIAVRAVNLAGRNAQLLVENAALKKELDALKKPKAGELDPHGRNDAEARLRAGNE